MLLWGVTLPPMAPNMNPADRSMIDPFPEDIPKKATNLVWDKGAQGSVTNPLATSELYTKVTGTWPESLNSFLSQSSASASAQVHLRCW